MCVCMRLCVRVCACLLTYISCALRNGEIGTGAPGTALVVPLAAAAVRACGVVLTRAAQLVLVHHTHIGVEVALATVVD